MLNPNKPVSYDKVFRKYIRRMILTLLVFGIPFAFLIGYAENRNISGDTVLQSVLSVMTGKSLSHLWYIYSLIGIYLVLPALWRIVMNSEKRELEVLLAIMFVIDFVLPMISRVTGLSIAFNLPFGFTIFYVLAGYYVQFHKPRILSKIGVNVLICVFCIACIIGIHYLSNDTEKWLAYDSPIIAIMALSIYSAIVMNLERDVSPRCWKVDRLCFGVYLIHPVFIQFCYRVLKVTPISLGNYVIGCIGMWVAFVILSFVGSWILNKIPFLRNSVL